ncbi:MAG: hypothetical protein MRY64_05530 [Hyphomonadaceae bacterium]|nr:hypothetical protein [Hyphomonadaceae bacterium]
MRRSILALLAVVSALPAAAESITIPPGLWAYSGTAQLGAGQMSDSGEECFRSGESTYSLKSAAQSIADGCDLTSTSQIEGGIAFEIACTGGVKGELSGEFLVGETTASLTAAGWTGVPEAPIPLTVAATAARLDTACE